MYPLVFKKVLIKKIWGGRAFEKELNFRLEDNDKYGESWEVSSHPNGMSVVENGEFKGKTLQELLSEYKGKLVGERIYKKYGDKFPLLIKYLDINDRLSVQVHPDDEYALKNENEYGKSESWYVLKASSDAKLILGIKEGITKDIFKKKVEKNDFNDLFNIVRVKEGDLININPGTVHASLEGSILICEPQQNSDSTYRIYDFDRIVDGKKRELHIDKALDVIKFDEKAKIINENSVESIKKENFIKKELTKDKYYDLEILEIKKEYNEKAEDLFKVYMILEGEGEIEYDNNKYNIKKGKSYLIPANLEININGKVKILRIIPK
ncbi:mannose-6-phosphate isomerase [Hypnocyclicus thermotrophus]|uniref:Phosphohexomutase n=1 Tax=Hypnocyclicus thermotrophus TaxID=1627895 RepID=A0AA46I6A1_9FUSO|nr:type I phosphomannose isomerase catalytic subunit [Hypnocyclicus thermotrophus]TDT71940.1 mannose-6-phosphate isomerase [Hypnocyclicus thermotrophus]